MVRTANGHRIQRKVSPVMLQEIVFQIARKRIKTFSPTADGGKSLETVENYRDWRDHELETQFLRYFDPEVVRDKDVLDFGCGNGSLSFVMAGFGARSCIGIDLDREKVSFAKKKVEDQPIRFEYATDDTTIDLPSDSVDVICCFDVMEHIMKYEAIMREWLRVLRPGGRVLIVWQPWFHPYGHHMHGYIPIPWVHVMTNHHTRVAVCARIVALPEFDVPYWDLDESGNRINRFQSAIDNGESGESGFLNKLTMGRFERLCRGMGYRIERRTLESFEGGKAVTNVSGVLKQIPVLREFFTAFAIYELVK